MIEELKSSDSFKNSKKGENSRQSNEGDDKEMNNFIQMYKHVAKNRNIANNNSNSNNHHLKSSDTNTQHPLTSKDLPISSDPSLHNQLNSNNFSLPPSASDIALSLSSFLLRHIHDNPQLTKSELLSLLLAHVRSSSDSNHNDMIMNNQGTTG